MKTTRGNKGHRLRSAGGRTFTPHCDGEDRKRAYFAAPLFTPTERAFNLEVVHALEEVFSVFLPERDGFRFADMEPEIRQYGAEKVSSMICEKDLEQIRGCNLLIAVIDGRVPDEGVCAEMGYAHALDIPVYSLKTDVRTLLLAGDNPIIRNIPDITFTSVEDMLKWAASYAQGEEDEALPG
jgi:nucleoside 2-deoxyribosyltransferase